MNGRSFTYIILRWIADLVAKGLFCKYYFVSSVCRIKGGQFTHSFGVFHCWGPFNYFSVRQATEFLEMPGRWDQAVVTGWHEINRTDYLFMLKRLQENNVSALKPEST